MNLPAAPSFETINAALLNKIPAGEWTRLSQHVEYFDADICPDFLGFVDIYWHLAAIIPQHWAIVDLGCAYGPQAYLFENRRYIGVDLLPVAHRFAAPHATHYSMSIGEFLKTTAPTLNLNLQETFAICSYVPMWGEKTTAHLRAYFPNLHVYYPHGGERVSLKKPVLTA